MIAALIKYFPVVFRTLARLLRIPYYDSATAVPVILPSSGTIDASGNLTLVTALPEIFTYGAWCYFPASAFAALPAGIYWVVFSSTTAGSVKTLSADPSANFIPYVPTGSLTAAVGSGAPYTQTTGAAISLAERTIAGNTLSPSGALEMRAAVRNNNSATTKTTTIFIDGLSIYPIANNTTSAGAVGDVYLRQRGTNNAQVRSIGISGATTTVNGYNYDFSASHLISFTATLNAATDYIIYDVIELGILQ